MKYTDLTKEQREHFDMLVEKCGVPPEPATHFDLNDQTITSWMCLNDNAGVYYTARYRYPYCSKHEHNLTKYLVPIPDKPWYDPKDVTLTSKPKIRKIVYDRNAFNTAINWILNNSPYVGEDWRNTLPLNVRRWMKDMIHRYDSGEIDGVSFVSSAGLTLMSSWEEDDVLRFELFADVFVGGDCGEYEYDPEDVF